VNFISSAPDDAARVVERLVAHPAVRRINFTGSPRVGRIIAQLAAVHLKPVLLQLGGGNPVVVLDDADLDAAVDAAVFSAFFNHGQSHMSADRIIVDRKIAIAFVEKLAAQTTALLTARATMPLAGMAVPAADTRVRAMPDLHMLEEESSGSVVSVLRFDTDEEAILLANDNAHGPSASVFSRSIGRAMAVARRIESGTCHINGPIVHDEALMQFGGVQGGGYGNFNSKTAIAEFTDLRWITLQRGPSHHPVRGGRHA
jgi:acyl-CoA reductase-like NAD-dependent aldehyde dehydrogenase